MRAEAAIGAVAAKWYKVRSPAFWQAKMLRNVSNGCFGEAAMQHQDIWADSCQPGVPIRPATERSG